jgi:transposase, IS5 family
VRPGWSAARRERSPDPEGTQRPVGRVRLQGASYKARVVDNHNGVVVDYTVEPGVAPDAPPLPPAIQRIRRRTGHAPRAVTADRGYGEASVEADLHDLGVRRVAISAQGQELSGATRSRTSTKLPPTGQVAHQIRRPD